jgi:hypothetical protein
VIQSTGLSQTATGPGQTLINKTGDRLKQLSHNSKSHLAGATMATKRQVQLPEEETLEGLTKEAP